MWICWAIGISSMLDVKYLMDGEYSPSCVWHDLVKDVTKNASHDQKREKIKPKKPGRRNLTSAK